MAQTEIQLRALVEETRKQLAEADLKVIEVLRGDEMKNAVIDFRKTALERHLNAYDEACQKYIEGKIDKISFRDMYRSEIRNLAENEVTSKLILSETSNYQSIKKVYKEWENKS